MSPGLQETEAIIDDAMEREAAFLQCMGMFGSIKRHWDPDKAYNAFKNSCLGMHGEFFFRECMWICMDGIERPPGVGTIEILEIGTHKGVSAALLAQFGHVVTFDIEAKKHDPETGHGIGKLELDAQDALWGWLGLHDFITAVIGNTVQTIEAIAKEREYSVAFVDGDHSFEGVTRDWEAVKHIGRVIFHDYKPHVPCHAEGVCKLVDSLSDEMWEKRFFPSFALVMRR